MCLFIRLLIINIDCNNMIFSDGSCSFLMGSSRQHPDLLRVLDAIARKAFNLL